jgi:type VI secretion system protein ImpH
MAAQSGGTDSSVERLLFEEGYRLDFFQAVRVLERLYPYRQPIGGNATPADEVVRFRSRLSLSFPPSAIHEITPAKDGEEPAQITVAFMGLTGLLGVLPRHYTELLLERVRHKDLTLRDFLDLFNHRLISLFYRAWEKYRVPIAYERVALKRQEDDRFTLCLFDLLGMGTKGLRGRLAMDDKVLLFYAGLLAQHPRSASALAGLLQDYFEVPVAVTQFIGQWLRLSKENRSCLGGDAANNALGVSAVAGERVWDQQAKFKLRVGPLTFPEFCQFLPGESGFRVLVQLSRFFAGMACDFDMQLILKAAEVPWCRLGGTGEPAARLGWSAWLKTKEFTRDAKDAIFASSLAQTGAARGEAPMEEGGQQRECEESEIPDWQTEPYLPQRARGRRRTVLDAHAL